MMRFIRWFLGNLILAYDRLFTPKAIARSPEAQARVDHETRNLVLYQYPTCPFCVKVRRKARALGLQLELRNANQEPAYMEELVRGGGENQVPCLRITEADGSVRWMYESSDINQYLESRFAA